MSGQEVAPVDLEVNRAAVLGNSHIGEAWDDFYRLVSRPGAATKDLPLQYATAKERGLDSDWLERGPNTSAFYTQDFAVADHTTR